jgi:fatty-acyl-CoA synthase
MHTGVYNNILTPVRFLERSATVFPNKDAVTYGDARYTYKQFFTRVNQFASALKKAGVGKGDKVGIICPNTPPCLEAHFAVPMIGAVLVPINTRIPEPEVTYIVNHSDAKVILVDTELAPSVDPKQLKGIQTFVNIHDPSVKGNASPLPGGSYEEFLSSGGDGQTPVSVDVGNEMDMLSLNYTSGTTGKPKGVMLHHRGAYINALGELLESGITGNSSYLWTLPMFHCNGWCYTWAVTAIAAKHVCLRKVDFPEIFRLIKTESVSHMCAAPIVISGMSAHANKLKEASSLKGVKLMAAGAPPSPTVIKDLENHGVNIVHVYGLTEAYGPHCLCEWNSDWESLDGSGRALKKARQGVPYITSHDADVVDIATMKPVPRDGKTVGEIVMKGNNIMMGYYKNPEATAEAFAGGWFHTGDLAVMHPDNYMEIVDRKKDIIISGGENISSVEVENTLYMHPKIFEAAVVAVPDAKWGEVPKAFIVVKPGETLTADDVTAHCRKHISGFKIPKLVEFMSELPHNAAGKLQKNTLRNKEWAGQEKRIN